MFEARRIPGPAGNTTAASGWIPTSVPAAPHNNNDHRTQDFTSSPWLTALSSLDISTFDENHPLLKGNTVNVALNTPHSCTLPKLLALVVSMKRAYSGEWFIRLADPTGTIGGTLTADVLSKEPDLTPHSVVLFHKATVIKMPRPRSTSHLCITADNIMQVIPADSSSPLLTLTSRPAVPAARVLGNIDSSGGFHAQQRQQQQQQPQSVPHFNNTYQPHGVQQQGDFNNAIINQLPVQNSIQQQQQQMYPAHGQPNNNDHQSYRPAAAVVEPLKAAAPVVQAQQYHQQVGTLPAQPQPQPAAVGLPHHIGDKNNVAGGDFIHQQQQERGMASTVGHVSRTTVAAVVNTQVHVEDKTNNGDGGADELELNDDFI